MGGFRKCFDGRDREEVEEENEEEEENEGEENEEEEDTEGKEVEGKDEGDEAIEGTMLDTTEEATEGEAVIETIFVEEERSTNRIEEEDFETEDVLREFIE